MKTYRGESGNAHFTVLPKAALIGNLEIKLVKIRDGKAVLQVKLTLAGQGGVLYAWNEVAAEPGDTIYIDNVTVKVD